MDTPIGLPNIGASCWLNSVLQLLFKSKHFCDVIIKNHEKGPLHTCLTNVINGYRMKDFQGILHHYQHLHSLIIRMHPVFSQSGYNDCHEVITYLINNLHEEEKYQPEIVSDEEKQLYNDNQKSLSDVILTIGISTQRITSDKEILNDSFITFFVEPSLNGDRYNDLQTTLSSTKFIHTPKVLLLSVVIPPETAMDLNNVVKINEKVYRLTGMIYFIPGMNHYISVVRNEDYNGWFLLNDAICNSITNEELSQIFKYYPTIIHYECIN